jgi:V/A-type H+-transporting ATPase subunit A
VLDVMDCCQRLVERGVAATTIEQADLGLVVRAREEMGPSDAAGVTARSVEAVRRLEALL